MAAKKKATAPHVLIAEARFYEDLADALAEGAIAQLESIGATYERVSVPGALELPAAIAFGATTGRFSAYVALGCVIRGETSHYDHVCQECARGLQDLAIQRNLAIGNGVITVENEAQAWTRARRDELNKGGGAAQTAIAMAALKQKFAELAA